jgi:cytochrome c
VSRVTDRPRNAANRANEQEMLQLKSFTADLENQVKPKTALITSSEAHLTAYKAIQINAFCLNCHGQVGQEISEENYAFIQSLYPEDQATSYAEGDLRGMWKIEFKKEL